MPDAIAKFRRTIRSTAQSCGAALFALGMFSGSAISLADEAGQRQQVPPEIRGWIEALTDRAGIGCCAIADGSRPEEVTWDIAGSSYRVKVDDQWLFVPEEAIVRGPNRLGYAVVWLEYEGDIFSGEITPLVRCFLPGAAS